jgi:negative regulator of flagellin synthesis FlgM
MQEIHGVQSSVASKAVEAVGETAAGQAKAYQPVIANAVELSEVGKLAANVDGIPDVRMDLVEQTRAEIAAGTYETPERIELAVTKLMEELFAEL